MASAAVGEVPEWLKGTDCKSVGSAYAGSNPALSTTAGPRSVPHDREPRIAEANAGWLFAGDHAQN